MAYIELEDAEEWIAGHVADAADWDAASDTEKLAALEQASDAIDSLPLRGRKFSPNQLREFPRIPQTIAYMLPEELEELDLSQYEEIPFEVQEACCLEAVEIVRLLKHPDAKQRLLLQEQGVRSATYGDSREEYSEQPRRGLLSSLAVARLRSWMF